MDYSQYITGCHADKPKFVETVKISAEPFDLIQERLKDLVDSHSFDTAEGKQLDTLGVWIGLSRYVKTPIRNTYFAWNTNEFEGWNAGIWASGLNAMYSYIRLDDDSYRMLLKLKIATNRWHGSLTEGLQIWHDMFGDDIYLFIIDNQDMSMQLYISGEVPTPILRIIEGGLIPFKPESVRVDCYLLDREGEPAFGFDLDNEYIAGWGKGKWPMVLN